MNSLQSGEVWSIGCKLCSCHGGVITCFTPECPACSPGYTPYYQHRNTSHSNTNPYYVEEIDLCCPTCQPISCTANCLACEDELDDLPSMTSGFSHSVGTSNMVSRLDESFPVCTACATGYKLQEGECVNVCAENFFERDGICVMCHISCGTCVEETKFHCNRFVRNF